MTQEKWRELAARLAAAVERLAELHETYPSSHDAAWTEARAAVEAFRAFEEEE